MSKETEQLTLSLSLEPEVGTMGVPESCWVFRLGGKVIGKCDTRDDTSSPAFWGNADDDELPWEQGRRLANAFEFARRLW